MRMERTSATPPWDREGDILVFLARQASVQ
jgi:hypothetical protein